MNIFAIRRDGYHYQELDLEIDDFIANMPENIDYGTVHDFSIENIALAQYWKPLRTGFSEIKGEKNLIPDVANWIGATLLLSPKANRYLNELLSPFGEFLPVQIENDTFYIFNCLTIADGNLLNGKFSFNEESIENKIIFKTPQQQCIDIYCTEQLKSAIETFELQGVIFDSNLNSY